MVKIISDNSFGLLDYSSAEFYKSFGEFIDSSLPEIIIPNKMPCLFFFGENDTTFNLNSRENRDKYVSKIRDIAPHAKLSDIRVDHFGRGEDHYLIGEKGIKFLTENEKDNLDGAL